MTEAEWLAATDPGSLLDAVERRTTSLMWAFVRGEVAEPALRRIDRRLRLLACACYRRVWPALGEGAARQAIEAAERFADGEASAAQLRAFQYPYLTLTQSVLDECAIRDVTYLDAYNRVDLVLNGWVYAASAVHNSLKDSAVPGWQCAAVRDVFMSVIRPTAFSPDWGTDAVLSLSGLMYKSRDFSAMPVLANALQDAGCENADILNHCRGPGPHVRGCWVVDLVLGKG